MYFSFCLGVGEEGSIRCTLILLIKSELHSGASHPDVIKEILFRKISVIE